MCLLIRKPDWQYHTIITEMSRPHATLPLGRSRPAGWPTPTGRSTAEVRFSKLRSRLARIVVAAVCAAVKSGYAALHSTDEVDTPTLTVCDTPVGS
jgi:hypothetical protein